MFLVSWGRLVLLWPSLIALLSLNPIGFGCHVFSFFCLCAYFDFLFHFFSDLLVIQKQVCLPSICLWFLYSFSCSWHLILPHCDQKRCLEWFQGSSVHGILQARVLEWVAISFSRGSSRPRDWTQVSLIVGRCFTIWTTREGLLGLDVLYQAHLCMKRSLAISNFLEEISSLSHSIVFLYFFALISAEGFLISLLFFGTLHSNGYIFPFLLAFRFSSFHIHL